MAVALVVALAAEMLDFVAPENRVATVAGMALAASAIGLAGFSVYGAGLRALRHGRLNIEALMTVAVSGAFVIGQWPEAAMVMALYAIAEAIEARAVGRAHGAVAELLALAPESAEMRDADGAWTRRALAEIPVGATLRVGPGERVPLDGVVTGGQGAVDQSPVTGESLPVDKQAGDELYAGTINQAAELEMRASAPACDSTLARIARAVEQAQAARAPMQRFVDRFAAIYTPAVFVVALAVALALPLLLERGWLESLYRALVLLVISCPCALVISTPVTLVSGLTFAARRGILIKGGAYLEAARRIRAVALDKSGTVTTGHPKLVAFEAVVERLCLETLQALAKSLAARSDHPVSKAVAAGLSANAREVADFSAAAGRGVQGALDGRLYRLANRRWVEELGLASPALAARLAAHEEQGRTTTLLADESGVLAICAVADTLKPSCVEAVAELRALGVAPVMLTGDNLATARTVAAQAGIDEVRANLLPADKLAAIDELQRRFGVVAMTGDGINDAPALAKADIGFAMGAAGAHIAMEAADVVVMNDDLRRLPETIRLSRRAVAVLWQNIALALGIKLVFLLLAVFGHATMWMAVFADVGASLLVVGNGLKLSRGVGRTDSSRHSDGR
jgi:Cd2+/Zn2+-exporting ATPase